jgi:CheY-like chemotaxis protein
MPGGPLLESRELHIVLVDDNVDAAETLALRLRADGHQVSVHHDGMSALAAPVDGADVYILDIGLPDLDGYSLARMLRRASNGKPSTFIALTGYGQRGDRERSREAGFHHHLVKPVDVHQLMQLLLVTEPSGVTPANRSQA